MILIPAHDCPPQPHCHPPLLLRDHSVQPHLHHRREGVVPKVAVSPPRRVPPTHHQVARTLPTQTGMVAGNIICMLWECGLATVLPVCLKYYSESSQGGQQRPTDKKCQYVSLDIALSCSLLCRSLSSLGIYFDSFRNLVPRFNPRLDKE